jgi:site-specific recombinase XerC
MVSEEILAISPMAKMTQPHVPEQPVPILTEPDLVALVWVTSGKGFEQRRDHAILRLFIDTGVRLNEIVGPTLGDVDLDVHDVVHVMGKGSRGRSLPFRSKTGTAIDRYLRERTGQPHARLPNLWIAQKGGTTDSGVAKMVRRRGAEAGVENLHRFRHS